MTKTENKLYNYLFPLHADPLKCQQISREIRTRPCIRRADYIGVCTVRAKRNHTADLLPRPSTVH